MKKMAISRNDMPKNTELEEYTAGVFPRRIEIELSCSCNLNCTYCPRKYLEKRDGFMKFELFKKLIDEISPFPQTILVLHRRGESLLHPDFIRICEHIKGKFKEVQIATNATLLDEAKSRALIESVSFVSFSIDIPEVFDKTRAPARYAEVEKNISRFLDLNKSKVKTQVSMVNTLDTPARNLDIFKNIWKGKVDRVRIYEEHSRSGKFGSLSRERGKRLPCVMPFYEFLVFYDGMVGRCNHDWAGAVLGDLNTQKIEELWNGQVYDGLRRQHTSLEITDEVCKNCDSWYPQVGMQGTGEIVKDAK
jgi:radical SAM protein with 4Fe4S-binding SPASM domain